VPRETQVRTPRPSCNAGARHHHSTRPHTAWENGGRRRTPSWAAQPPPRRTAQRQLAGGSAGAQSDSASSHRPNRPTGNRRPRARTPSNGTFPEGELFHSPGLLRSSYPGFPPQKVPEACRASLDRAAQNMVRTPRPSCRAGAPPHHSTRPHTAWENGGRRRTPGWAPAPITSPLDSLLSPLSASSRASAGWWKRR
jgi:hypothetical protein